MERIFSQELRDTLSRRFRSKSLYISAVFLLLISLACAFSGEAMLNLLGYEFSMVISLVFSQIIALIAANEAAHFQKGIELKKYRSSEFALAILARSFGLLIAMFFLALFPLVTLALNSTRVINCNMTQGILFYVLIPFVTGWASLLMTMSFTLFFKGNAKKGYSAFLIYSLLTIFVTLWKLYSGPRVSFYNFILGSVVLFNYNTVVPIDSSFILARSLAVAFSNLLFLLAILGYERNKSIVSLRGIFRSPFTDAHRLMVAIACKLLVIYLVVIYIFKGPLGVDISNRYLNKLMDGHIKGKGVELRFPADSIIAGEMDRILKEHEWHYAKIVEDLQLKNPPLVVSYIYPTSAEKTRLTGVGGSVFAKPWMAKIHVEYSDGDINALRHELTHILAGEFGAPVFKASWQTGLSEGLSEATEWNSGALDPHQWAQAILKGDLDNRASPIYTMRNEGFWSQRVTVAYYVSGSFVRWLIDTYGLDKFKTIFRRAKLIFSDKLWINVYGKSLRDLTTEWMAFLKTYPEEEAGTALAQFTFQRPAFTEQKCSHEVAERSALASAALGHGQYKKALEDYDALMRFQPDDPYHGWGKIQALIGLKKYDQALKLASDLMKHPKANDGFRAQLIWQRASILATQEKWAECKIEVQKASDTSIYPWMKRDSIAKLVTLAHPNTELRKLMFKGMDPQTNDSNYYYQQALVIDPNFWPAIYLVGRRLRADGDFEESVRILKKFLSMSGYDPIFRKEADMTLIDAAFRSEKYPLAYLWADSMLSKDYNLSMAEKASVMRWKDRIEWIWKDLGHKVIELNMINLKSVDQGYSTKQEETPTSPVEPENGKAAVPDAE